MKYLFLDVDGVLNNADTTDKTPMGFTGISDILVEHLAKIIAATGTKIILSSDWKVEWNNVEFCCSEDAIYLNQKLKKQGLHITNRTYDEKPYDYFYTDRGVGIHRFLDSIPDYEGYVVLDDHLFADFDEDIRKHFVHTDGEVGLTEQDVELAIKILNNNLN